MIPALATVFSKLDGQRRFLGPFLPAPQGRLQPYEPGPLLEASH
jgi:hypothetical protein